MTGFKAILFDCDGVLLDSEPLGCTALAEAITFAGRPMNRVEAAAIFSGSAASESRAWMAANGFAAEAVFADADRRLFKMFDREIPLIPGIETILAGFAVPMAVCSNASRERLERSLLRSPLAVRFGPHVWSADDVARAKPAPDMALKASAALGLSPHETVFLDDNIHGIRCAREAGALAIGFIGPGDHRPGHAETLRAAGAHHVVHGMLECHALLTRLSLPLAA